MSDIQKGYTFTEKATDWASNKETALRLNKMIDDAKLNLVAGTNITITPGANGPTIASTGGGGGTVTGVTATVPIVSTGTTAPVISITAATTSAAGSMSAADKTKLNAITGTNTGDQTITLTGGVTGSGTSSFAATVITNANLTGPVTSVGNATAIANGAISNAMLANSAVANLSGTNTGDQTNISGNAATVTTNANLTGNVTSVGNTTTLASIPAISGANLTTLNASNLSSGTVAPARLGSGSGGATKFLREDSTFQAIPGGGDALTSSPLSQFAATTSAQLAGVISDETGTGALVFATSPTLTTPALGAATATTINKVTVTQPTSGSTLTIQNGFTLTASGNATVSGTNTGDNTVCTSGAATTAVTLLTARAINGVSFDGSAPITITAAGSTLSDTVPVAKGGTGTTTLTANGVLVGNGTSAVAVTGTGAAGQVLTSNGSSAAPTFQPASGGSAIGVPTAGNLYSRLVKDISGTITTSSNMKWSGPDVFNVKDYGAVGDGSTPDGASIALAITALQAYSSGTTRGTLYFPDGTYLISSAIAITLANGFSATIRGNGRYSSIILQTGASANGITATMTAASTAQRWIEICDLGFVVADNVVAGTAISIDYGATATESSDAGNAAIVTRVAINTKSYAGGSSGGGFYQGGWTSGVIIRNPWKAIITDVSGVGRAALSASGSIPTTGAGSGSFIGISGGQNIKISDVDGMFWQNGLYFYEDPSGVIGGTLVCTNFCLNAIGKAVWFGQATFYGHTQFSNFIIDQGNNANIGYPNIAFFFDTNNLFGATPGGYMSVATGFITQKAGSTGAFEIKGYNQYGIVTGVVIFTGTSFLHMYENTNSWIFNGNQIGGTSITFDAGANYNQINCTGGSSTITDNGTGNTTKATLY